MWSPLLLLLLCAFILPLILLLPITLASTPVLLLSSTKVILPVLQPRVTCIPSFLQRLHTKQLLHLRHTTTDALLPVGALL